MRSHELVLLSVFASTLTISSGMALAADQVQTQSQDKQQVQKQDRIYGSQLMTRQERMEFRAKLRAAKTAKEWEQLRKEHHELMKERAKERGLILSDEPPPRVGGMGPGPGPRGGPKP